MAAIYITNMLYNNNELILYSFELISYSFLEAGQVKSAAFGKYLWDFANTELMPKSNHYSLI